MGLLSLLWKDPLTFFLLAVALLYSVIVHELAHGWVAYTFGDPTARYAGRLTLNPLRHLDIMGTAMLFLFGFGWARPVPVDLGRLSRLGFILVSAAGIAANTLLAFLAVLAFRLAAPGPAGSSFLYYLAQINIMLASFNLIPIPPLDGSKILMGFLPERFAFALARLEPYGLFLVLGLLYLGVLDPLIRLFRWLILFVISLLLS